MMGGWCEKKSNEFDLKGHLNMPETNENIRRKEKTERVQKFIEKNFLITTNENSIERLAFIS